MLTTAFKEALASKQVDTVGNMLMFRVGVSKENLSHLRTECCRTYCKSVPETVELIKRAVTPEVLYNAAFHAVETLGFQARSVQCLITDPINPAKINKSTIEQEYYLDIMPYTGNGNYYVDPDAPRVVEDDHYPLITREDLQNPQFLQTNPPAIDLNNENHPSACFKFKAKVQGVEKIFLAKFHYGYFTMDPSDWN